MSFDLYDNLIRGSVPVEIFGPDIIILDIEDNILTGKIFPNELFDRASTLKKFSSEFQLILWYYSSKSGGAFQHGKFLDCRK